MFLILGAGEMTQWVKILIALSEDLNLVLSSHIGWLTIFSRSSYKGSSAVFHSPWISTHFYTSNHRCINKNKMNFTNGEIFISPSLSVYTHVCTIA